MNEFTDITTGDLPDLDKLVRAYRLVTNQFIDASRREIELQQALGDREAMIKEQIKLGMMETAWEMFEYCYLRVTGRRVRNDEPKS